MGRALSLSVLSTGFRLVRLHILLVPVMWMRPVALLEPAYMDKEHLRSERARAE